MSNTANEKAKPLECGQIIEARNIIKRENRPLKHMHFDEVMPFMFPYQY